MNKVIYISNIKWLLLSFVVVLLDLISKLFVVINCVYGESIYIFSFVNCYYVHNFGIAFSLLSQVGTKHNVVLSFAIILIILVLIFLLCTLKVSSSFLFKVGYSVMIGGAIGNVFDRVYYGAVVDFIDCHIGNYHWPTFNVADLSIFIGVVCLLCKKRV